jgi:hypothetical protein
MANGWNDGRNGTMPDAPVATNGEIYSILHDACTPALPPHEKKLQTS